MARIWSFIFHEKVNVPFKQRPLIWVLLHSPGKHVHFLGEPLQQAGLGGVGEDEDDVHVTRTQLDEVTHIIHIRQLRHLHKTFPGNPGEEKGNTGFLGLTESHKLHFTLFFFVA